MGKFIKITALAAVFLLAGTFLAVGYVNVSRTQAAVVKAGSNAGDIKAVQLKLKQWGYYGGKVDGVYGPVTAQAVRNYQKDHGLKVDGIAGSNTLSSMGIASGGSPINSGGSNPPGNADAYLLSRCIYAEARGEPYEGQVAIGAVILNRVRHPDFPNTISGVIYQPGAFTVVSDGQINLSPDSTAQRAAQDALNGWDPTHGCIFYYNPATATSQWIYSRPVVSRIGRHVFCM